MHQKDAVNDDEFDNYLSSQTNQVSFCPYIFILVISTENISITIFMISFHRSIILKIKLIHM